MAAINPVDRDTSSAEALAAAAAAQPGIVTGARFVDVPPSGTPHGVSDALSHFPSAGDDFSILTTGNSGIADADNVSGSSGVSLGGGSVRGNTDFDVTVLAIDLDVPVGRDCLKFDFAFYSEEYPEWVGSAYNDAFIAELDDSTWTTSGSTISAPNNFAFDADGKAVTINSAGPAAMSELNAGGTTYDGATVLLEAATPVTAGAHTLYLSIFDQGDQVYDSAAFVDNIRVEQTTTTCEPGAKTAIRRPVIFLHGITGSFLEDANGNEVWPDEGKTADRFNDEHLDVLKLADDGATAAGPDPDRLPVTVMESAGIDGIIDTTRICLVGDVCHVLGDAYETTFDLLENTHGYTRGQNLFPFAYDWRLSISTNAQRLLATIDDVRAATGEEQVNIMAHSQGGLVTSAALADDASIGKVDRVVTLGTPYLGATKSLGVLDYAEPCQAETPIGAGCFLNREKAQELATNWPGFLALLPSRAFYEADHSAVHRQIDDDGDGTIEGFLSFHEVRNQLADRNLGIIDQVDALHQQIDHWDPADPSVRLFRVVGDTSPTIQRIVQFEEEQCSGHLWWRDCEMRETFQFQYGNGDGTVPLHSADLYVPDRFDLRGAGQNAYAGASGHGDLPKEPAVLDFAVGFLAAADADASVAGVSTSSDEERDAALYAPPRESADEEPFATASAAESDDGMVVRDEPLPLTGTELLLRGAVIGEVTDTDGGRLGTVDADHGIELQTIPGSAFLTADLRSSYFVTRIDDYSGTWTVTEDSEVRLLVRRYADDEVTEVVASPTLALEAGARLAMHYRVPTDLSDVVIEIDDDGDGTVDRAVDFGPVVSGTTAQDREPPVTNVATERIVTDSGDVVARVTMSATDTGGSGVDRIEYALDETSETGVYSGPFEVPAIGHLMVRAIDRAGNVEGPYQMISLEAPEDDAPNRRSGVNEWHEPHANFAAFVDYPGDTDWWGLELDDGRHQFQLIGLQQDYNLSVRDASGTEVASGTRAGTRSERIVTDLSAGRYYLVVTGVEGAYDDVHAYRLNATHLGSGKP